MLEKDKMIFKVLLTAPLSAKVDISGFFRGGVKWSKNPHFDHLQGFFLGP
jgi:hypothetical protein